MGSALNLGRAWYSASGPAAEPKPKLEPEPAPAPAPSVGREEARDATATPRVTAA